MSNRVTCTAAAVTTYISERRVLIPSQGRCTKEKTEGCRTHGRRPKRPSWLGRVYSSSTPAPSSTCTAVRAVVQYLGTRCRCLVERVVHLVSVCSIPGNLESLSAHILPKERGDGIPTRQVEKTRVLSNAIMCSVMQWT